MLCTRDTGDHSNPRDNCWIGLGADSALESSWVRTEVHWKHCVGRVNIRLPVLGFSSYSLESNKTQNEGGESGKGSPQLSSLQLQAVHL